MDCREAGMVRFRNLLYLPTKSNVAPTGSRGKDPGSSPKDAVMTILTTIGKTIVVNARIFQRAPQWLGGGVSPSHAASKHRASRSRPATRNRGNTPLNEMLEQDRIGV